MPDSGRWLSAGEIMGDTYSLAWRIIDAQHFGVPQRRRRIFLVVDFDGQRAGKILFESEGVSGYHQPSQSAREGAAADAPGSAGGSGELGRLTPGDSQARRQYATGGTFLALQARERAGQNGQGVVYPVAGAFQNTGRGWWNNGDVAETLRTPCGGDSTKANLVVFPNTIPTLRCDAGAPCIDSGQPFLAMFMGGQGEKARSIGYSEAVAPTLKSAPSGGNTVPDVVYALQGNGIDRAETAGCNGKGWNDRAMYTLNTIDKPAVAFAADCRNGALSKEVSGTLQAKPNGGESLNCILFNNQFTPDDIYDQYPVDRLIHDIALAIMAVQTQTTEVLDSFPTIPATQAAQAIQNATPA